MISKSVTEVRGVGPETKKQLAKLNIYTIEDLLTHFPFRYENYEEKNVRAAEDGELVTVQGIVHSEPSVRYFGKKQNRLSFRLRTGDDVITVVLFNRAFLKRQIVPENEVVVTGKWDERRMTITASTFKKGPYKKSETIVPIYSLSGKLTPNRLRRYIRHAFEQYSNAISELLPPYVLEKYKLPTKKEAIEWLHFPKGTAYIKHARRRIVYEEFLLFQLKMQLFKKVRREHAKGTAIPIEEDALHTFEKQLPFSLTDAQKRVITEINNDLTSSHQMNRLLQGDVGSGKTVVAAIAMFGVVQAGYQAALMVPTEILADQHTESLQSLLHPLHVKVEQLTGSMKAKERTDILKRLAEGEIDIIIGTHALIQEDVHFHTLGFIIIDEQHRFGVEQRRTLREKGIHPDVLFMTATPIPRTLAISAFGDMDVSIIDELPAGRQEIETYWASHSMFDRVLQFMNKQLEKGRQAYVICPLIEESDKIEVQNAIDVYHMLIEHFQEKWQIGLMHGRLHQDEKEKVMESFSNNDIHILVSTTVVEVGVNVPNATVMVIYDADRFGLAQLHQLRGRVGRGDAQSYCILLADPKSNIGKERMKIMTETSDGFELSERDLQLRGPGDFFGEKQSGLPNFKLADIVHDYRALEVAREDAHRYANSTSFWNDSIYAPLRKYIEDEGVLETKKLD